VSVKIELDVCSAALNRYEEARLQLTLHVAEHFAHTLRKVGLLGLSRADMDRAVDALQDTIEQVVR
jgi:hypothetical protein